MAISDSAKAFGARFKLDSHHAIERFGILFGALTVSCILVFSATAVSAFANNQEALSSKALYTPTFTTSKTGLSGEVPGIFVNADKTRAMVLMHFKDTAKVSGNAQDYRGFLTGSTRNLNQESLQTKITGKVIVFGSTGYMGVVLDSDKPFNPQVMNLTMRNSAELVYKEAGAGATKDLPADGSFAKYDQWQVFFNPGGSEAQVSPALGAANSDIGAIFNEVVVSAQEKTIRDTMDGQLALMQTDLNRINDGTAELGRTTADGGSLRLVAPAVPKQIAGDVVEGKASVSGSASTLKLKTGTVLAGGYDFDWRGGSVRTGYLKDLVPDSSGYVAYLAKRAKEPRDEFRVNEMKWMLNDGTDLKADYSGSNTTIKPLTDIMNKLSQAYQDYYKDKTTYQVEQYGKLIDLEVSLRNVESNSTTNSSSEALVTY